MVSRDYINYTTQDFLVDEEFRSWVMKPEPKKDYFWRNLIASLPEKASSILKAKALLLAMQFNQHDVHEEEKTQALEKILQQKRSEYFFEVIKKKAIRQYIYRNWDWWVKIAATFLILIFSISILFNNKKFIPLPSDAITVTKVNPAGQKLTFKLPDGTIVTLNSESEINYTDGFGDNVRFVNLKGEAYFNVAHNEEKPFIVKTGDIATEVLGTSFNVHAFPDENTMTVAVVEGKVKVIMENEYASHIILEPREKLTINRSTYHSIKTGFDHTAEVGWKDGILFF
jgi:transmembrane sensor